MASSAASTPAPSLAQPTITAIQQQIAALLPSNLASAITSQFAGAPAGSVPVLPATVGAMPVMAFSLPGSGSAASASGSTSLAQSTITAIQQQIMALLPSGLASAITSQFAGASSATGQAVLPTPSAASAASILPSSDLINTFLSLPQAT